MARKAIETVECVDINGATINVAPATEEGNAVWLLGAGRATVSALAVQSTSLFALDDGDNNGKPVFVGYLRDSAPKGKALWGHPNGGLVPAVYSRSQSKTLWSAHASKGFSPVAIIDGQPESIGEYLPEDADISVVASAMESFAASPSMFR